MKKLINNDDIIEEKTFEEVLEEFKPLVGGFVYRWRGTYDGDDVQAICNMKLWDAYRHYDHQIGVGFPAYAEMVVTRGLYRELNKYRRAVDLDGMLLSSASTSDVSKDFEDYIVCKVCLEQALKEVSAEHREIFTEYHFKDMSQKMIAGLHGVSQVRISTILKEITTKLKEM